MNFIVLALKFRSLIYLELIFCLQFEIEVSLPTLKKKILPGKQKQNSLVFLEVENESMLVKYQIYIPNPSHRVSERKVPEFRCLSMSWLVFHLQSKVYTQVIPFLVHCSTPHSQDLHPH